MVRVSTILSYHYRASTRLRLEDFDIHLENEILSRDPDSPKFEQQTTIGIPNAVFLAYPQKR